MLKNKQLKIIEQVINMNEPIPQDYKITDLKWKILIYDNRGFNIIKSLFPPSHLTRYGVTFHSHINNKRDPISDVGAVYFIEPTKSNINILTNDLQHKLYDRIYINFVSEAERELIQDFAKSISAQCEVRRITSLFDRFIDFNSYEPCRFELFDDQSYFREIYGMHASEDTVNSCCKKISERLRNIFLCNGELPVLFFKQDSASKIVARDLCESICSRYQDEKYQKLFASLDGSQPICLIIDRSRDFSIPLHHGSCYQSLLNDEFGLEQNSLVIDEESFELHRDNDDFWKTHAHSMFEQVANDIAQMNSEFQKQNKQIAENVIAAMTNLSNLSQMKESLTMHAKIVHSLIAGVKKRRTNALFEMEWKMFCYSSEIKYPQIHELLNSITNQSDRIRLIAIAYFYDYINEEILSSFETEYSLNLSFLQMLASFKVAQKKHRGFVENVLGRFNGNDDYENVMSHFPVVDDVRKFLDGDRNNYTCLNTKTGTDNNNYQFNGHIYLFIVGPGCHPEFDGICRLNKEKQLEGVEITYGCTKVLKPCVYTEILSSINQ